MHSSFTSLNCVQSPMEAAAIVQRRHKAAHATRRQQQQQQQAPAQMESEAEEESKRPPSSVLHAPPSPPTAAHMRAYSTGAATAAGMSLYSQERAARRGASAEKARALAFAVAPPSLTTTALPPILGVGATPLVARKSHSQPSHQFHRQQHAGTGPLARVPSRSSFLASLGPLASGSANVSAAAASFKLAGDRAEEDERSVAASAHEQQAEEEGSAVGDADSAAPESERAHSERGASSPPDSERGISGRLDPNTCVSPSAANASAVKRTRFASLDPADEDTDAFRTPSSRRSHARRSSSSSATSHDSPRLANTGPGDRVDATAAAAAFNSYFPGAVAPVSSSPSFATPFAAASSNNRSASLTSSSSSSLQNLLPTGVHVTYLEWQLPSAFTPAHIPPPSVGSSTSVSSLHKLSRSSSSPMVRFGSGVGGALPSVSSSDYVLGVLDEVDPALNTLSIFLDSWLERYVNEPAAFESLTVWVSLKYAELRHLLAKVHRPNSFRTWIVADLTLKIIHTLPLFASSSSPTSAAGGRDDAAAAGRAARTLGQALLDQLLLNIYTRTPSKSFGLVPYQLHARQSLQLLHDRVLARAEALSRVREFHLHRRKILEAWQPCIAHAILAWHRPLLALMFLRWRTWRRDRLVRGVSESKVASCIVAGEHTFVSRWLRARQRRVLQTTGAVLILNWKLFVGRKHLDSTLVRMAALQADLKLARAALEAAQATQAITETRVRALVRSVWEAQHGVLHLECRIREEKAQQRVHAGQHAATLVLHQWYRWLFLHATHGHQVAFHTGILHQNAQDLSVLLSEQASVKMKALFQGFKQKGGDIEAFASLKRILKRATVRQPEVSPAPTSTSLVVTGANNAPGQFSNYGSSYGSSVPSSTGSGSSSGTSTPMLQHQQLLPHSATSSDGRETLTLSMAGSGGVGRRTRRGSLMALVGLDFRTPPPPLAALTSASSSSSLAPSPAAAAASAAMLAQLKQHQQQQQPHSISLPSSATSSSRRGSILPSPSSGGARRRSFLPPASSIGAMGSSGNMFEGAFARASELANGVAGITSGGAGGSGSGSDRSSTSSSSASSSSSSTALLVPFSGDTSTGGAFFSSISEETTPMLSPVQAPLGFTGSGSGSGNSLNPNARFPINIERAASMSLDELSGGLLASAVTSGGQLSTLAADSTAATATPMSPSPLGTTPSSSMPSTPPRTSASSSAASTLRDRGSPVSSITSSPTSSPSVGRSRATTALNNRRANAMASAASSATTSPATDTPAPVPAPVVQPPTTGTGMHLRFSSRRGTTNNSRRSSGMDSIGGSHSRLISFNSLPSMIHTTRSGGGASNVSGSALARQRWRLAVLAVMMSLRSAKEAAAGLQALASAEGGGGGGGGGGEEMRVARIPGGGAGGGGMAGGAAAAGGKALSMLMAWIKHQVLQWKEQTTLMGTVFPNSGGAAGSARSNRSNRSSGRDGANNWSSNNSGGNSGGGGGGSHGAPITQAMAEHFIQFLVNHTHAALHSHTAPLDWAHHLRLAQAVEQKVLPATSAARLVPLVTPAGPPPVPTPPTPPLTSSLNLVALHPLAHPYLALSPAEVHLVKIGMAQALSVGFVALQPDQGLPTLGNGGASPATASYNSGSRGSGSNSAHNNSSSDNGSTTSGSSGGSSGGSGSSGELTTAQQEVEYGLFHATWLRLFSVLTSLPCDFEGDNLDLDSFHLQLSEVDGLAWAMLQPDKGYVTKSSQLESFLGLIRTLRFNLRKKRQEVSKSHAHFKSQRTALQVTVAARLNALIREQEREARREGYQIRSTFGVGSAIGPTINSASNVGGNGGVGGSGGGGGGAGNDDGSEAGDAPPSGSTTTCNSTTVSRRASTSAGAVLAAVAGQLNHHARVDSSVAVAAPTGGSNPGSASASHRAARDLDSDANAGASTPTHNARASQRKPRESMVAGAGGGGSTGSVTTTPRSSGGGEGSSSQRGTPISPPRPHRLAPSSYSPVYLPGSALALASATGASSAVAAAPTATSSSTPLRIVLPDRLHSTNDSRRASMEATEDRENSISSPVAVPAKTPDDAADPIPSLSVEVENVDAGAGAGGEGDTTPSELVGEGHVENLDGLHVAPTASNASVAATALSERRMGSAATRASALLPSYTSDIIHSTLVALVVGEQSARAAAASVSPAAAAAAAAAFAAIPQTALSWGIITPQVMEIRRCEQLIATHLPVLRKWYRSCLGEDVKARGAKVAQSTLARKALGGGAGPMSPVGGSGAGVFGFMSPTSAAGGGLMSPTNAAATGGGASPGSDVLVVTKDKISRLLVRTKLMQQGSRANLNAASINAAWSEIVAWRPPAPSPTHQELAPPAPHVALVPGTNVSALSFDAALALLCKLADARFRGPRPLSKDPAAIAAAAAAAPSVSERLNSLLQAVFPLPVQPYTSMASRFYPAVVAAQNANNTHAVGGTGSNTLAQALPPLANAYSPGTNNGSAPISAPWSESDDSEEGIIRRQCDEVFATNVKWLYYLFTFFGKEKEVTSGAPPAPGLTLPGGGSVLNPGGGAGVGGGGAAAGSGVAPGAVLGAGGAAGGAGLGNGAMEPAMSRDNFMDWITDSGLLKDKVIYLRTINAIWQSAQASVAAQAAIDAAANPNAKLPATGADSLMVYGRFLDSLRVLAAFLYRDPMQPLPVKVDRFVAWLWTCPGFDRCRVSMGVSSAVQSSQAANASALKDQQQQAAYLSANTTEAAEAILAQQRSPTR